MLQAIIVDDEKKSREGLRELIELFVDNVTVTAICESVDEAILAIDQHKPDILFLDLQMRQETGFDLLARLPEIDFDVVITTAYSEYALRAFKFAVTDYLLKPIHIDDLRLAVSKVEKRLRRGLDKSLEPQNALTQTEQIPNSKIALPTAEGLMFVRIADIIYLRASGSYTEIFIKDGKKVLVSKNLKEYEDLLAPQDFFRIHHNTLVHVDYIQSYVRGDGGYVIMSDNTVLDVSRRKKEAFLKRMGYR